jgi:hypothetical protein
MNRYEVRTQDDEGLCGIVTDETPDACRNLTRGIVSVWDRRDPALGYAAVGYDPMAPGPLVLVVSDMEGREVHREEVREIGTVPPGVVTMTEVREHGRQPDEIPPLDVPAPADRGPDSPVAPKVPVRVTTAGPGRFA